MNSSFFLKIKNHSLEILKMDYLLHNFFKKKSKNYKVANIRDNMLIIEVIDSINMFIILQKKKEILKEIKKKTNFKIYSIKININPNLIKI